MISNTSNIDLLNYEEEFFARGRIVWNKSEEQVWAELSQRLENKAETKTVPLFRKALKFSAAAVLVLAISLTAVTLFYSRTIQSLPGEHKIAELPDGSVVDLNAGSSLTYYPLKFRFDRTIQFEGEGYFEVERGKSFSVESANGTTTVLGTSFNIFSRDDNYRVSCITGKVRVSSSYDESVILEANSHVQLEKGKLVVKEKFEVEKALSWKSDQFYFPGTPLSEVFDEIERQYAVTIQLQPKLNHRNFTSNFPKKYNVEDVLDYVCKSMQIKFVKQSENVFLIVEKS